MCGITGWVSTVPSRFGPRDDATLLAMRDCLRHRGPDDEGAWFDRPAQVPQRGGCALGFRRLSIIDLHGGHQPMGNEDGQIQVVFNGEIYNHQDLRDELQALGHRFATRADTEVLVHGWEAWGVDLLPRLNGMFALAIWDGERRQLLLGRDRMGKKPLFVAVVEDGRTLVFGSELSAVIAHPAVPHTLDPRGLQSLLLLDYIASPRTPLTAVHTLKPGQFWLWSADGSGAARVQVAGFVNETVPLDLDNITETEALAELDGRLSRAVGRRLMADVPLGIFLSGGIDSSLVTWYAAQHRSASELDTFSIGFDDQSFDESSHARAVARHLGTRHHERVLTPAACLALVPWVLDRLDLPLADASILPTTFLAGFAREKVTVALGGDGGDEWWLGYPTFLAHTAARWFDRARLAPLQPLLAALVGQLPVSHRNLSLDFKIKRFVSGLGLPVAMRHLAWIGGLPSAEHRRVLHPDVVHALTQPEPHPSLPDLGRPELADAIAATYRSSRSTSRDDYDALATLYARFYLGDGVLQKVDRASMLHSLEVRAPLLDPEVVALARALPTRLKLRGRTTKWLLRRLAADKLPDAIVQRPKKGFGVPMAAWLRGPLLPWLTDVLAPARVRATGLFDADGVQAVLGEHLAGRVDHRKVLWSLACYLTWHGRLMAGVRPGSSHGA